METDTKEILKASRTLRMSILKWNVASRFGVGTNEEKNARREVLNRSRALRKITINPVH